MISRSFSLYASGLAIGALLTMSGCSGSDSGPTPTGLIEHPDVLLLDAAGTAIPPGSTVPYSPRTTCGACHDVDRIANGFHFQQGRTDSTGRMIARRNHSDDGRQFILSAGMYGKW